MPEVVGRGTYLLVATGNSIVRVSLDGTRYRVLISNLDRAISIDYFYKYVLVNREQYIVGGGGGRERDGNHISDINSVNVKLQLSCHLL